jgi:hypothetical protein
MTERGLGRRPPTDDRHLRRYSLTAETLPVVPTPVAIGVNWYAGFDEPVQKSGRSWWLPAPQQWGGVRGGHEVCLKPPRLYDLDPWYRWLDQKNEGACVGFALTRMMMLLNRQRYDPWWLWNEAKKIDEWDDTNPGDSNGTSGRAGCDVLRTVGHCRVRSGKTLPPEAGCGISENRWANSVNEIATCLDPASGGARVLNEGYVTMLNSWGENYPQYVRMPLETLERLVFAEDGDATVVVDRP